MEEKERKIVVSVEKNGVLEIEDVPRILANLEDCLLVYIGSINNELG